MDTDERSAFNSPGRRCPGAIGPMPVPEQSSVFLVATTLFGLGAIASMLLTARGLLGRSWIMMWVAALASLVTSIVAIFSIGALIFLVTCLQLGAAVALRRGASAQGWVVALLVGLVVWLIFVPLQILGSDWLPPSAALVLGLIVVLWMGAPLLPAGATRSKPS